MRTRLMSWKKHFFVGVVSLLTVVTPVGPIWAVPVINYVEPPDGVNFVLTIFEAAFGAAGPAPAVPPQTGGFWLTNRNQFQTTNGGGGASDTLVIAGNSKHLRGPVGDPHGQGKVFTFNFNTGPIGNLPPGLKNPPPQAIVHAHGNHRDEFQATLAFTTAARPNVANAADILSYSFEVTGVHVPVAAVPEPTTLLLWGTAITGLGFAARRRQRSQK